MNKMDSRRPTMTAEQDEAFVRHVGKARSRVYAFILSLVHDWNEADEIFQETLVVLWRKFPEFQPESDFVRWGCRVAQFEVYKYRERVGAKELTLAEDVLEKLAEDALGAAQADHDLKRRALAHCLERLRPVDRELLQLRYGAESTTQSVAEHVGRSVTAVYKALNRIRWALLDCVRRQMAKEGGL
jgi:RNA polymerase sigma-70 factor (ECF subfamily)